MVMNLMMANPMLQRMNQNTITYRLAVGAVILAMLALLASACKSPTEFDIPQRVDSTQAGDTVLPFASGSMFVSPFTQTIAVNGFMFFRDLPLGGDVATTETFAGTLTRRAGHTSVKMTLNLQHDPVKSYYGAGSFIPYQAIGLTLNVADMPVDSLRITTVSADEAEGAATISLAEYDANGRVVAVNAVPASLSLSNAVMQFSNTQNGGMTTPIIQCQVRLISTIEDSGGNLYFYRVDGMLFIAWP